MNSSNQTGRNLSTLLHNDTVFPGDMQQATKQSQRGTDGKVQKEIHYVVRERMPKDN